MSNGFDRDAINRAVVTDRWAALVRTDVTLDALQNWDVRLLRQSRVLVPVDVQALYVPAADQTRFVSLPFTLTTPDGSAPAAMPPPFDPGTVRPPGVHLHWAPPDALLRGSIRPVADGSTNRLSLPPLPDRWVVLRLLVPTGASAPQVRGWVIEADTTKVVPLETWPSGSAGATASGKTVARDQLTGSVGGTLNWVGVYDAVANRFSLHDPLTDLATVAPQGAVEDLAAYVVVGWWSDATLDPLDGVETAAALQQRLTQLGWRLMTDAEGGDQIDRLRAIDAVKRETLGLKTSSRYAKVESASLRGNALRPADRLAELAEPATTFKPTASQFIDKAQNVIATEPRWPRSTLLHGVVHGVPVRGPIVADQRPALSALDVVMGHHGDDVAATLASPGFGAAAADRRAMERLLAAFTGQVLDKLGTADGAIDAEEHEHLAGFVSLPGGPGTIERLTLGGQAGPLAAGRAARGEQARLDAAVLSKAKGVKGDTGTKITWAGKTRADLMKGTPSSQRKEVEAWIAPRPDVDAKTEVREVRRPAPRFHVPLEPLVAVRGPKRSLRHAFDGRFSPDGRLQCRWPSQVPTSVQGLVDGADFIRALPSGAVPGELLLLARSAIVQDPYLAPWLASVEAKRRQLSLDVVRQRLIAESALRFGRNGVYDGRTGAIAGDKSSPVIRSQVADELRRFSLVKGVDADPVGVTAWSQPWIPLWLEWEVALELSDRFDDWSLAQIDLEPPASPAAVPPRSMTGRSALTIGTARTIAASITEWLRAEEQRDANNQGEVDDATAAALDDIAEAVEYLDVVTVMLDSLHERLLGLPVDDFGRLRRRTADGGIASVAPEDLPQLVAAGLIRLTRARIVDGFGRTLDLPVANVRVPARDEVKGTPPALSWRPRFTRPARWLFRFVDPADLAATSREATIDQIDATKMVNPVAGFILPDHVDEALEVFDIAGQPLGQLMHEPIGGGVIWEIAPGRLGPADAGPLHALGAPQQVLGHLAAGLVAADAAARAGQPADAESALSALLRAVDTTLWTVDTFAQFGNEHIAGLVGRPIAVVRATLRLEIDDDLDELDLSDPDRRAAREAVYRSLADRAFPVRIGELTRSDDGLLAFFVDDDFSRIHVVDKAVRDGALDVGQGRGQLAQLGSTVQVPNVKPITHPYVFAEDELHVHPGQTLRLTLLMHPASKVHLTSGVLPRKALQLARDWVQPGLAVIAPSVRVGPVLLDADQVRLPKVSSFPKEQLWTRRDTPSTWKDDPILAATQTALLPDIPSEVQEGYIRVGPKIPTAGGES